MEERDTKRQTWGCRFVLLTPRALYHGAGTRGPLSSVETKNTSCPWPPIPWHPVLRGSPTRCPGPRLKNRTRAAEKRRASELSRPGRQCLGLVSGVGTLVPGGPPTPVGVRRLTSWAVWQYRSCLLPAAQVSGSFRFHESPNIL